MTVTVDAASKITAGQWVAMIRKSPHIPNFVREDFKAKGNVIIGPTKIKQPTDTIPKDWPDDLVAAFASDNWEITTAQANFEIVKRVSGFRVQRHLLLDLQTGEFGPGIWLKTGPTARTWMPDNRTFDVLFDVGAIAVEFGETFTDSEARLKSRRPHLIIIVNRVSVFGVKPGELFSSLFPALSQFSITERHFDVPEAKLLSTFFHELAAHGGRMNEGKNADHGNAEVELDVADIEELFPQDDTVQQIASAVREAANRMEELDSSVGTGRTPGPVRGTSPHTRTPGPLGHK